MTLETLTWPEARSLGGESDRVFVVPLGSFEQHGRHLPMITDTAIITEIARRVESAAPDSVVLTPTLWIGHSPHHRAFACISLDVRPYMDLIAAVCRSLIALGARRIMLLNGHGGNDIPAKAAMRELKSESPATRIYFASYWQLAAPRFQEIRTSPHGGMNHACEMETSVMLAIQPDAVDMARASDNALSSDMLSSRPFYVVNDFDEISESGTVGSPSHATAEKGERFLAAAAEATLAFLRGVFN
ncbi:MAG: creatininase family protein [Bryobacterales bacterium]|nr:creatininase family protein [Bryobacterales bacterium]